jgi:hypothetical protein
VLYAWALPEAFINEHPADLNTGLTNHR